MLKILPSQRHPSLLVLKLVGPLCQFIPLYYMYTMGFVSLWMKSKVPELCWNIQDPKRCETCHGVFVCVFTQMHQQGLSSAHILYVCVCVCVYLPSCIIQGSSRAHIVLSPYLYLSNISLKFCTFAAVTISSLNLFQTSTVLCGKLYFLM